MATGTPEHPDQDSSCAQQQGDGLFIGQLPPGPTGEAKLHFSRRLENADGSFDGVVVVDVNAGYFVSGYETSQLGQLGVLGLFGTDGVFRVRRTAEAVYSGDAVDYAATLAARKRRRSGLPPVAAGTA